MKILYLCDYTNLLRMQNYFDNGFLSFVLNDSLNTCECCICKKQFLSDEILIGIREGEIAYRNRSIINNVTCYYNIYRKEKVSVCKNCAKWIQLKDQIRTIGLCGFLFMLLSFFILGSFYSTGFNTYEYLRLRRFVDSSYFIVPFVSIYFCLGWYCFAFNNTPRFFILPKKIEYEHLNADELFSKWRLSFEVNKLSIVYGIYVLFSIIFLLYINFVLITFIDLYLPEFIESFFCPMSFWIEVIILVLVIPLCYVSYIYMVYQRHLNK